MYFSPAQSVMEAASLNIFNVEICRYETLNIPKACYMFLKMFATFSAKYIGKIGHCRICTC